MTDGNPNFDAILCDAVTDGIATLGDSVRQTICYYLATDYNIKVTEIPGRTKDFDAAVGLLLGRGAGYLEDIILKQLYAKIGYDASMRQGQPGTFKDCVEGAAKFFRSKKDR